MPDQINIYCDESCHLENDDKDAMVLGAIWAPMDSSHHIARSLRELKKSHGLNPSFEMKWTKVSPAKIKYYLEAVRFFFEQEDLHFRAIVIPDKSKLRHSEYDQDHDTWYYKMYFEMLKWIIEPENEYRIFPDIKDTKASLKIQKLHDVLANNIRDFRKESVQLIQTVRSHEVEQIQLADLLIGAVSYTNRNLSTSGSKLSIIRMIEGCAGQYLNHSTPNRERKFNLFMWKPDRGKNV